MALAASLLLADCGQNTEGSAAAKPVATLKARHLKAALPNKAALPGWTQVGSGRVETDTYTCEIAGGDACNDVVATGTANFIRGKRATDKWLRFSFNVYSCRTVDGAKQLYKTLPDYTARPDNKKVRSLGDESAASSDVLKGPHTIVFFHDKVRVGTTVMWTYARGSDKSVTTERAEMAAELQTKRVQQAHKGVKPTASVNVP
ncbi:hypothetical protein [Streptomyces sp. LaPpAH-108]|uniref:hypothetical protein n=1 Tax=Streptomyces sp. LaPpAH-108 TaxID=1155714 RepID=UPI001319F7F3|nr:hypothetical protein [Streptomyces sp. LaPpAH-108]